MRDVYIKKPEVIVKLLDQAINGENNVIFDSGLVSDHIGHLGYDQVRPSLKDVAEKFTLNEKQNCAFNIAGNALLSSFHEMMSKNKESKNKINPLRLYLGGEGGTGKSRVIESLQYLAKMWGRPNAVQTIAPTGKAAFLVNGSTIHSKFKFSSRNFKTSKMSAADKEKFRELVLLIYDECGMAGKYELGRACHMLRKFVGTKENEECRVHVVLSGDFFSFHL